LSTPLLKVQGLQTRYGASQVLFDVGFEIYAGEVVTLLGRNGMGKTTSIMSIMGARTVVGGKIEFDGRSIKGVPSFQVALQGIGLVPEGRRIFPNLTVRENLIATARRAPDGTSGWDFEAIMALFPALACRLNNLGNQISGGEQQMLAIGRALLTNPKLLILDEATEGLAPLIRVEIWRCLETLKERGFSILVVDKNIDHLARIADRHYVIEKGKVAWSGTSEGLRADSGIRERYLTV